MKNFPIPSFFKIRLVALLIGFFVVCFLLGAAKHVFAALSLEQWEASQCKILVNIVGPMDWEAKTLGSAQPLVIDNGWDMATGAHRTNTYTENMPTGYTYYRCNSGCTVRTYGWYNGAWGERASYSYGTGLWKEPYQSGLPTSLPETCEPTQCPAVGTPYGPFEVSGRYMKGPYCLNECVVNGVGFSISANIGTDGWKTYHQDGQYSGQSCGGSEFPAQPDETPCDVYLQRCETACRGLVTQSSCSASERHCDCEYPSDIPLLDDPSQTPNPQPDQDGDGIGSTTDPDVDGDGTPNGDDPDVDDDGTPNGDDPDVDGDGQGNGGANGPGWNPPGGSPGGLGSDPDIDGDGTPNGSDPDIDGDGIGNGDDTDIDGDGIPNGDDLDMDGDGIPNGSDPDIDGDGIPNGSDPDMDGDGVGNGDDPDADGDGIPGGTGNGDGDCVDDPATPEDECGSNGNDDCVDDPNTIQDECAEYDALPSGKPDEPYSPSEEEFNIGERFETFISRIRQTGVFALPNDFFNAPPSGGSPVFTFEFGSYGTRTVDLSDMSQPLLILRTIVLIAFGFVCLRVIILKR